MAENYRTSANKPLVPRAHVRHSGFMSPVEHRQVTATTLGGPSLIIEFADARFLVDPTFDPPGDYPIGDRALTKTTAAVVTPAQVGPIDAVLLSHDQHPDNLDQGGRAFLATAPLVLTTTVAATRLAAATHGLEPGESLAVRGATVTAVAAQHGPDGSEAVTGPVIGFVLSGAGLPTVYISGDNASLGIVEGVAERFGVIDVAVLFAGAARTPLVDGFLTLTSEDAVKAARILGEPRVLPVHTDGWAHFTQDGSRLRAAFASAGLDHLIVDAPVGRRVQLWPPVR